MKWILIVLGVIAGLAVVLFAVGSLQPKEHAASITVHIAAPDSAVWATITDFEKMPEWYGDVRSVERIPDIGGKPAYHERYASGWVMTTIVQERVEEDRLVREILPSGAFSGTWTFYLASEGEGTRLMLTEHGRVENPMFRAMMMFGDNTRTMRRYVAALKKKLGVGP